jgi:hypothetical protein
LAHIDFMQRVSQNVHWMNRHPPLLLLLATTSLSAYQSTGRSFDPFKPRLAETGVPTTRKTAYCT